MQERLQDLHRPAAAVTTCGLGPDDWVNPMPPFDTIEDEVFGELTHDPPMQQWCGEVELTPKHRIEVAIWWDEDADGPLAPVLERARLAYRRFLQRQREHREALAAALLERYRRRQPEDETAVVGEVARGLTLLALGIAPDGSATLQYEDAADLFGDHCILAELDWKGDFAGFTLQG